MSDDDDKDLLRQAEDELGATPGAYCSRKVALRAMELLRAADQTEADRKAAEYKAGAENNCRQFQEQRAVIERQAQAIQRLGAEKTRGGLGQARNPPMGEGILKQMERSANKSYYDPGALTQQVFRETLNRRLDQGKRWTEH